MVPVNHEWSELNVSGFADGETDFRALLDASPQGLRDEFDNFVMSPLVNGMADGVLVVISGHADRIDTGLEDHRQRIGREALASSTRAQSAEDSVLAIIGEDWLDPPPATWNELREIAVYTEGHGATTLINDGCDEAARRENRRVTFRVCRFMPDE